MILLSHETLQNLGNKSHLIIKFKLISKFLATKQSYIYLYKPKLSKRMRLMLRNFYASLVQRHPRQLRTALALGKKNLSIFFGIIGMGYLQPSAAAVQARQE